MEMEVLMPSPAVDFKMESACTSPYISAPSSPPRIGTRTPFFSAPTSPNRATATANGGSSPSAVPFDWEEKPGIAKANQLSYAAHHHHHQDDDDDDDFAFDFSGQLEKSSLPADELFDGGKIKPLKPPPRLLYENKPTDSPKAPRSPKKMFKEAFSPRHKSKDFDPFEAALDNTRLENTATVKESTHDHQRGRERTSSDDNNNNTFTASSSRHKGTRSLSPFRVSDLLLDQENPKKVSSTTSSSGSTSSAFSSFSPSSWYRKWKLKDLLLFRSASEGRPSSKAQLNNKYDMLKKTPSNQEDHDVKNSSFRSADSVGSVSSTRTRSGPISAHELHYTVNRSISEEMKRKTFLPYKQGLLGCLGFNPAVNEISKGIGSMSRG